MEFVFVLIIALIILLVIFVIYSQGKKSRKLREKSKAQYKKTLREHEHLKRRLDYEQDDAARRVELRNKTLEMYEQVKTQSESGKPEAAAYTADPGNADGPDAAVGPDNG